MRGEWKPPTRSAIQIPAQGGCNVETREIALAAVMAALYAFLVIGLAPISYGPLQLRIADALIPLAMVLGWPVVAGVTIGCAVANFYGQLGTLDYVLGPLANLLAGTVVYLSRRRPILGFALGPLPIGIIVGSYLWTFFSPPPLLSFPEWLSMIVSVTISTYVVMGMLGYILFLSVSRALGPSRTCR